MAKQRFVSKFPVEKLHEHPDNPRRGDEDAINDSLEAHGFYGAVIVQASSGAILAGNHRTRVAARRGDTHLPVLLLDVDDDEARRILLVDNRTADLARYDDKVLAEVLAGLVDEPLALTGSGFDVTDLARLLARWGPTGDVDDVPEPPAKPRTKRGDLWTLGEHRLLCGDSTDVDDVARLLDGLTPRAMVTDPPYLVDYDAGNHPQGTRPASAKVNKTWDSYTDPQSGAAFFEAFIRCALVHLEPAAPVYQWHAVDRRHLLELAWLANGLHIHQTLVWVKEAPVLLRSHFMQQTEQAMYGWRGGHQPGRGRRPPPSARNVWMLDRGRGHDLEHPTVKPVQLYTDPYTWHLRTGEWAYEPFSGSGTAIAAAEVTDRRCAAMELEPAYVDVACRRWQALTGTKPELNGKPHDFA